MEVLVNKLRPFLDSLVGPLQSSFIPGRGTTDNALIAQEIIHHIHKSKSNQGLLAAKLDLEKAYDRVDWDFLEKTLDDFSFPARIVSLIVFCIRSSLFILWNGSKLPGFVTRFRHLFFFYYAANLHVNRLILWVLKLITM
jgi:hypothetical protein